MQPRLRVAISGGGIGGMSLAVALSRYPDIEVAVYEAAESLCEVGAGVMLWGRTWRILTLLGLDTAFRELAGAPGSGSEDPQFNWTYRRSDGGCQGRYVHKLTLPSCSMYNYHRAHVLELLARMLPERVINLGKRVVAYHIQGNSDITIMFADGSTTSCDVLVGCDGIKSIVRRCMFEKLSENGHPEMRNYIEPIWTGEILFRALIPSDRVPKLQDGQEHPVLRDPIMYCGTNKHFMAYPIAKGKWANIGGFSTNSEAFDTPYREAWVQEASPEELLGVFSGWETELQAVLKVVEKPTKWAVHQLRPLPTYTSGQVVLLGDAAHAMTTHHAAGAGQALEDAYILAGLLGHSSVTRGNSHLALKAYELIRRPFATEVMGRSLKTGSLYEFRASGLDDDSTTWASALHEQFVWVYSEDPQVQLERGMKWMEEKQGDVTVQSRL